MSHPNKIHYPINSVWRQRDGGLCIVTGHFYNKQNNPFSTALALNSDTESANDYFTFFDEGRFIDGDHPEDLIERISIDPSDQVRKGGATLKPQRKVA